MTNYWHIPECFVSWEPEGHYQHSKMFHWEPEGRYRCTKSMAIAPFWFSVEHLWILVVPFWLSTDGLWLSLLIQWLFHLYGTVNHLSHIQNFPFCELSTCSCIWNLPFWFFSGAMWIIPHCNLCILSCIPCSIWINYLGLILYQRRYSWFGELFISV